MARCVVGAPRRTGPGRTFSSPHWLQARRNGSSLASSWPSATVERRLRFCPDATGAAACSAATCASSSSCSPAGGRGNRAKPTGIHQSLARESRWGRPGTRVVRTVEGGSKLAWQAGRAPALAVVADCLVGTAAPRALRGRNMKRPRPSHSRSPGGIIGRLTCGLPLVLIFEGDG